MCGKKGIVVRLMCFMVLGVWLPAQSVSKIRYEGTSNTPTMVHYRKLYEDKSKEANGATILCDAHLNKVCMNADGRLGGRGECVSKPHNVPHFLIGEKRATCEDVERIGDFICLQESLALTNPIKMDFKKVVRDCWDYYKYCICLFLKEEALQTAEVALQAKKNYKNKNRAQGEGEKLRELVDAAVHVKELCDKFSGPARFNIETAGRIPDLKTDELLQQNRLSGYQAVRNTMKYSFDLTPTSTVISRSKSVPQPKYPIKETAKTDRQKEAITPSSTYEERSTLVKPVGPKPAFVRGDKKHLHVSGL